MICLRIVLKSWSADLWHRVIMRWETDVSEDRAVVTQKDSDLTLHRRENIVT
jgi:hypothetical protein